MTTPLKKTLLGLAAASACLTGSALAGTPSDGSLTPAAFAITASHVVVDGGEVIEDGLVLIDEGRIVAVGKAADLRSNLAADLSVHEHEGYLTAGIVAANGVLGLGAGRDDTTNSFMQELELLHSFDPTHKQVRDARDAGVTSFGLTSGRFNVAGGVGAVVKTHAGGVVAERSQLALCLTTPALRGNRYPTSYGGALAALRERFAAAEGSFGEVKEGKLGLAIAVDARHEIQRAIGLLAEHELRGTLRGAARAGDFAEALAAGGHSVALAPLSFGAAKFRMDSLLALGEAGVPFAFGLADGGKPADLRTSAALAARAGLDRGMAWKSLTSTAASMLGAGDRVGRVAAGLDADLLLWSGDPLDFTTRLEAVYVDGVHAEGGAK